LPIGALDLPDRASVIALAAASFDKQTCLSRRFDCAMPIAALSGIGEHD
jgi:hypothetical protein